MKKLILVLAAFTIAAAAPHSNAQSPPPMPPPPAKVTTNQMAMVQAQIELLRLQKELVEATNALLTAKLRLAELQGRQPTAATGTCQDFVYRDPNNIIRVHGQSAPPPCSPPSCFPYPPPFPMARQGFVTLPPGAYPPGWCSPLESDPLFFQGVQQSMPISPATMYESGQRADTSPKGTYYVPAYGFEGPTYFGPGCR